MTFKAYWKTLAKKNLALADEEAKIKIQVNELKSLIKQARDQCHKQDQSTRDILNRLFKLLPEDE